MPVQKSNFKISARPDLATYLLQILIPATFNSLECQKGQFTLQISTRRWYVREICVYYPRKVKIEKKFIEIFACPNRKFLWKLPVQKTGRTVPGYVPALLRFSDILYFTPPTQGETGVHTHTPRLTTSQCSMAVCRASTMIYPDFQRRFHSRFSCVFI